MPTDDKLRFPIGKYIKPDIISKETIEGWIIDLEQFPDRLRNAVKNLSSEQLNTPYRPGGWTVRQVVHHCADSHLNSFIRFKLALTEEKPTIKPYYEARWANLPDAMDFPIESSLKIIEGVHQRWIHLIKSLSEEDLNKVFIHPEHNKEFSLIETIGLYAWHSNHHLAHITSLNL